MKISKRMLFLIFITTISCTIKKNNSKRLITKVVLYKQATTATDADFSFDKKGFWDTNFQEHTFIYQIFADNEYQNIIEKVKKMHIVAYRGPQHFTGINYAFVAERKSKKTMIPFITMDIKTGGLLKMEEKFFLKIKIKS